MEFDGLRLLRQIGSGGHAVVHEALQTGTGKHVAVKMLRAGSQATAVQRARFEQEARLAGRLSDDSIVKVTGFGWLGDAPYLVMDLVQGPSVAAWLASSRPDVRRRLRVFSVVCRAVAHAHQRMVVHRDLKPSNILISEGDAPKVLDFGIAREIGGEGLTATGEFMGTLIWAAPEQIVEPQSVNASTDVHGLGLLLFFLLTGREPHAMATASMASVTEAVVSRPLPRPSQLADGIGSDLDAIVAKATQKESAQRYRSVEALQSDVEAWLEGRPVKARKPTTAYLAWKYLRRHPFRVALGVGIACLACVAVIGWARAAAAEERAMSEAAEAQAVSNYVVAFFDMVGSGQDGARPGDAWTLLEAARRGVTFRPAPRTETSARLLISMGRAYEAADHWHAAEWLYANAVASCREDSDAPRSTLADALSAQSRTRLALGHVTHARTLHAEALGLRRALFDGEALPLLESLVFEAQLLMEVADWDGADEILKRVLAQVAGTDATRWPLRAEALELRSAIAETRGDVDGAVDLLYRALRARDASSLVTDPARATVRLRLGAALVRAGRAHEGDGIVREAVGFRRRVLGVRSPAVAEAMEVLAEICLAQGRGIEADLHAADSLSIWREVHGAEHPRIAAAEALVARARESPR